MPSVALNKALKVLPAEPRLRIRVALAFRDLTQAALASATEITAPKISNAMNGYVVLSEDEQAAVARVLDAPRDLLFPEAA